MYSQKAGALLGSIVAIFCLLPAAGQQAEAGTLRNGWNYVVDSSTDATERTGANSYRVGGSDNAFETYGIAVKDDGDSISIAINTNTPVGGVSDRWGVVRDGHTAWGDILFNFSGQSLPAASASGSLFGIRFADNNESGVSSTGVFSNVSAKSVGTGNDGWNTLTSYNNAVIAKGGTPSIGDLGANDPYFENQTLNVIDSGTKVGDINFMSAADLSSLDFGYFGATGSQTFGVKFAKSLLPIGSYIVTVAAECFNDAIALVGETTDTDTLDPRPVPEPSGILGLIAVGLMFGATRIAKSKKLTLN